jgi:hypothetical protein
MNIAQPTVTLTRPANVTAYAAGDVVSDGSNARFVFSDLPDIVGRGFVIESAVLIDSANVGTKPDLELWLFDADLTDLDADNAPWTPSDAQLATLVGIIPFPTASFKVGDATAGAGGNSACVQSNVRIAAKANTLYGVLVVRNAYVPVSGEQFTIRLGVVQNTERK